MKESNPLCPYCGREQRYIERRDVVQSDPGRNHSLTMYQGRFECVECGTYSPLARREYTEAAARRSAVEAAAWNRRHVPAIPSDPLPPSPIDPVVQHHPCNDCPFDPATCKPEECDRLKRYEAAREATP